MKILETLKNLFNDISDMYCLDTNILIFFVKNKFPQLNQKLLKLFEEEVVCITAITVSEFLYYPLKHQASKSLDKRQKLLDLFPVFSFDKRSAQILSQLKVDLELKGQKVADFDLAIASIALTNNLILVTNNTKHFQLISGLRLEDWSK